ncbi:MAG: tetratricopeptide repeat protein [Spirochaetia bacterium]|jgi:tetratricopeptide (TPR) repeat protein|nr:tetratricopeptide repeat protein [Spirochaetia bacterium]
MKKPGLIIFYCFISMQLFSLDQNLQIDLYKQGNNFFQEAVGNQISNPKAAESLYEDSLLRFLQLTEDIQNGKLYYNIGNIYYNLGDMGRAILNYRKAALLIPGDRNLKENLESVREQRVDTLSENESVRILETVFFIHYNLSSSFKSILFGIALGLTWISAAVLLLKKKINTSLFQAFFTSTIVFAVLTLFFLGSVLIDTMELKYHPGGVITTDAIIARKGDGLSYSPSFEDPLHSGLEFTLINERSGWYYIELSDKSRTWIPDNAASLVALE